MDCPVCGRECVRDAPEILDLLPDVFSPCPDCSGKVRTKRKPPADRSIRPVCGCGKRFIDDVFVHCWVIMVDEGVLEETDPLKAVGTPLVHPGFAMDTAPYLPEDSLVLLSPDIDQASADRLFREVPEIRGVIRSSPSVPGITDLDLDGFPDVYELLAGCDVRANVFYTQEEPIVIYKQQSLLHIEFPRGYDPKIINVGVAVKSYEPTTFVDACAGPGTLGILGGLLGVPHVILNDIWWAAAFWSACNVHVNRSHLSVGEVRMLRTYDQMKERPVVTEPLKVAETTGDQQIDVYQGDMFSLVDVLPETVDLTVIDLFGKDNREKMDTTVSRWKELVGGEIFIP